MKRLLTALCMIMVFGMPVHAGTKTVIVRTNPQGYETAVNAKPLMTYQQAETMIRQNEKIIRQN
ncbi:MAG: hypothetical protein D6726_03550, partial [Nitrospirae bacterium]